MKTTQPPIADDQELAGYRAGAERLRGMMERHESDLMAERQRVPADMQRLDQIRYQLHHLYGIQRYPGRHRGLSSASAKRLSHPPLRVVREPLRATPACFALERLSANLQEHSARTLGSSRTLMTRAARCDLECRSACARYLREELSEEDVRMRRVVIALVGLLMMAVVGCGAMGGAPPTGGGPNPAPPRTQPTAPATSPATSPATAPATSGAVSLSALPLDDGNLSTTPEIGYVDACQTTFGGGGAMVNGPWIHGSTWDSLTKISVRGSVTWPQARNHITVSGSQRIITTDDLPEGFTTGAFPIASTDPAFAYDRNPNTIIPQSLTYTLPATPRSQAVRPAPIWGLSVCWPMALCSTMRWMAKAATLWRMRCSIAAAAILTRAECTITTTSRRVSCARRRELNAGRLCAGWVWHLCGARCAGQSADQR